MALREGYSYVFVSACRQRDWRGCNFWLINGDQSTATQPVGGSTRVAYHLSSNWGSQFGFWGRSPAIPA